MTKEEKNIAIAEFMGAKYCNDDPKNFPNGYYVSDLPEMIPYWFVFDCDWNWLMKAWYKFRDLNLEDKLYSDNRQNIAHKMSFKTISEAFEALYEGIYWYNSTRK